MSSAANRWRPRRAGIVNLYEYADQTFDFAGGRLLLRGHNTSGKTKALEVLLPFCLDGDVRARKLDPFASGAKEMKWNLVGCVDQEQRTGYVWLEFECLDERGVTQRLTAGIGMRAHRSLPDVTRWYFIARDRSVGADLDLLRAGEPIGKAELSARLGDDGEVLDGQRDYRERLREVLFGFGSEERYQAMLRLMLDLRRPHLSKTLDPNGVAEQLSSGLPQIDDGLMRRLAGGLEQLETLERSLLRLRDVRDRLRRFHQRTYNAYARAIVRERAEAVRRSHTAVEKAAEQVRATGAALDRERERASRASAACEAAERQLVRLTAEEQALLTSEAWSTVAEVEALRGAVDARRDAARAVRAHADHAAESAALLEAELITARATADEQRLRAHGDLADVLECAERAGLAQRTRLTAHQLQDDSLAPAAWGGVVRAMAGDWRDVLRHHRTLLTEAFRAAAAAERARAGEREAIERLEQATTRLADCEQLLDAARAALDADFANWRASLAELILDDDEANAALELALVGSSARPAIVASVERLRTEFADARAALLASARAARDAIAAAEQEIERLASTREDGPLPPAWRRADRADRPGAPLWRLVDFHPSLGAEQRARLEAALEASGLLDAWVTPTGTVQDCELADVLLVGAAAADGPNLGAVLTVVTDGPVPADVVGALLAHVGVGARDAGPWVDLGGRFVLGPLAGRGAKDEAEHVGAGAREARRQRRAAELRGRIARLEAEVRVHEGAIDAVERRRCVLDDEFAAVPQPDAVRAASDAVRSAASAHADATRQHEIAAAAARAAADAQLAADAQRRDHGATHGLPARVDEPLLERMADASTELLGLASAATRAFELAASAAGAAARLVERLATTHAAAQAQDRHARDEEAEAERLGCEHAAREQALGATGEAIRRRRTELAQELRDARDARRGAEEETREAHVAAAGLEREAGTHGAEHERARQERQDVSAAFAQLAGSGILRLVLRDAVPDDIDRAETWTVTRTLELARGLPDELLNVRSGSGELAVEVQRGIQLLDRELAEADMGAYTSRGEDGLQLVRITETGGEQTLGEALESLAGEIADREQVLTVEERRVFNDALVEEIADHLRHRIFEVRDQVERMNAVLRRSPTAAGKTVELEWQPLEDDAGTRRAALALVRRDIRHLRGEARDELVAFFRERIGDARREHGAGAQPQPMSETLMQAFDYRRWFAFALNECSQAGRTRLTKRRHAIGSGGEQSVLIHLPLFAAAAALYADTPGPRLIMLDEAVSGIDDETRERVLAATVAFDLDVVMTSHELWGTYRSVPQMSIYQLHRENGVFGVHAIPFLWDGDVLRELDQSELLV